MSDRENNISENDKAILTKFIEFAAWADDHMTEIEDREIAKDIEGMLIHLGLDFNTYLEGMNTIDELLKQLEVVRKY